MGVVSRRRAARFAALRSRVAASTAPGPAVTADVTLLTDTAGVTGLGPQVTAYVTLLTDTAGVTGLGPQDAGGPAPLP
ncbi:hypothetical protein [Streptomyces sp. 142MFCol3.1]|uniref:hypothetical protein n=1 Tax=Streptomyces sp. 142MFCol3.1 TaxID=1172179 RepID=UPI00048B7AE6|nr:hypothetical protein [Streptomyces sp. 142MFCol3.1]